MFFYAFVYNLNKKIPINNDPHKALLCDECVTVKQHYGRINFAAMKTCNPLGLYILRKMK